MKKLPDKPGKTGLLLIIVGVALIGLSFAVNMQRGLINYLIMYMFIVSVSVGSLGIVALEYVVGAVWSTPFRRVSEIFASLIPFLILLVLPVLLGMHDLYHWTHLDVVAADEILTSKSPYLNVRFFMIRAAAYFLLWFLFYTVIIRNSRKQDETGGVDLTKKNIKFSIAFAPVFLITLTFSSIDFMMSLDPHWYSTMYGVYYFAGTLVSALAVMILGSTYLMDKGLLDKRVSSRSYHSMSTLMFGLNIFWAYIAFSQVLLIWYADIPEETVWLLQRWDGNWKIVSLMLLFGHFVIPFLVLISHSAKTNMKTIKIMAVWLLFAHYLDLYWLVMPNYGTHNVSFSWNEIGFPIAAAGMLFFIFSRTAEKVNLMPVKDPKLEQGLDLSLHPDLSID